MQGTALLWLPDVLRAAGLQVVEYGGWETRSRSSGGFTGGRPFGVFWHHTASDTSPENDASYCCHGSDSRPICNLLMPNDGTAWVLAAGATNTNGKGRSIQFSRGTVELDQANTSVVGMEICNSGVGEPYRQEQIDACFAASNAINAHLGNQPEDLASHHFYAPDRKIDPATVDAVQGPWRPRSLNSSGTWNQDDIRAEAARRAGSTPGPGPGPTPPPTKAGMMFTLFDMNGDVYGGYMDANGIFAQVTWMNPGRATACLNAGAEHIGELSPNDLKNCDLLGPCPEHTPRETFANVIG